MPRSKRCVFLRYAVKQKRYWYLDFETREIRICRDVIFDEENFPFLENLTRNNKISKRSINFMTTSQSITPITLATESNEPSNQEIITNSDSSLDRDHSDQLSSHHQ